MELTRRNLAAAGALALAAPTLIRSAQAQSADDGRLARQHEFFHVGVEVGELEAEAEEKFVHVRNLQVVVLLIAHDNQPTAMLNVTGKHVNVRCRDMWWWRVRANGLLARIGNEQQVNPHEGLRVERFAINAHVEFIAEARENFLVRAVGQVTSFAGGVVVTAVEKDWLFGRRIGGKQALSTQREQK